ncbi:DUF3732 domain-containing protein [Halomonas sp. HG01]|uniref:DUF3732 domain-containing protein n=1 Tax=Halomonas sp. HG01 TaxID=1609967 RepID=UPI0006149299|nr:DUF3732 domain-containing protein [Halomonas sp. HG01]
MKSYINEMGVIDVSGKKHPVFLKPGLNVITGKSSTGKSALIEIFDYCFASSEYTVPKGVITEVALIYYVCLSIEKRTVVLARSTRSPAKGFFKELESYSKNLVSHDFFDSGHYIPIAAFKKHVTGLFLDLDDVDESINAKQMRGKKASTPSIRSFVSFMLQHQNLVANKHALFYRFDEKEKRDQVIEHSKVFLGLVDQDYFLLSQEKEQVSTELRRALRENDVSERVKEAQKRKVEPMLTQLYLAMGVENNFSITLDEVLRHPNSAMDRIEQSISFEDINLQSNAIANKFNELNMDLASKTSQLRSLQRKANSIKKSISDEKELSERMSEISPQDSVDIAYSVCPFCHTSHEQLKESAINLKKAIDKISNNAQHASPLRAKLQSSLSEVKQSISDLMVEISKLQEQIQSLEDSEEELADRKSLQENFLKTKYRLFVTLETLGTTDDSSLEEKITELRGSLADIDRKLAKYDYNQGMRKANRAVNKHMREIGRNFDFEDSYQPINLKFSFETFDLYHEAPDGDKIFLRSMGSGANWLYSHLTLFLALHKYFASLGKKCSIPSILFIDQPTQVYFPSFKRDTGEEFDRKSIERMEARIESDDSADEDIKSVENLFSQLSIYCNSNMDEFGFSPQLIVTDHADDLALSNGVDFESLVNNNRWRKRGLIHPLPNNL